MGQILTWLIPPGLTLVFGWIALRQVRTGRAQLFDWFVVEREDSLVLFRIAQASWILFSVLMLLVAGFVVYG